MGNADHPLFGLTRLQEAAIANSWRKLKGRAIGKLPSCFFIRWPESRAQCARFVKYRLQLGKRGRDEWLRIAERESEHKIPVDGPPELYPHLGPDFPRIAPFSEWSNAYIRDI